MLDGWAKARADPLLDALARRLVRWGASANQITVIAWVVGLLGAAAIAAEWFLLGLFLFLLNRLGDGLDGAVARLREVRPISAAISTSCSISPSTVPCRSPSSSPTRRPMRCRRGASLLLLCQRRELPGLFGRGGATRHEQRRARPQVALLHHRTGRGTETMLFFVAFCLFRSGLPLWHWYSRPCASGPPSGGSWLRDGNSDDVAGKKSPLPGGGGSGLISNAAREEVHRIRHSASGRR
jgi:hypothetical protein